MSTRRTLFTDNFTQADSTRLNTDNWEYDSTYGWGARDWFILSNAVASNYGSAFDEARCLTVLPADQWAQVEVVNWPNSAPSSGQIAILLRMNTDLMNQAAYWCEWNIIDGNWRIWSGVEAVVLAEGSGLTLLAGDVLRAEVVGNVITMYKNDEVTGTYTDGSNLYASGFAGFGFNGQFTAEDVALPVITSFLCGDYTEPAAAEEPQIFITT